MAVNKQVNIRIDSEDGLVETTIPRSEWLQILGALAVGMEGAEFDSPEELEHAFEWLGRLESDV
jgi:hypothetical protein